MEDAAIERILAEDATGPHQQEYRLAIMADTDDSVGGYITAWNMSQDPVVKNRYFQRILEITRKNPTRTNYSKAYLFCRDAGKNEVAEQLLNEMSERYPLFSKIQVTPLKMASLFKKN